MPKVNATITRRNISTCGQVWQNVVTAGRRVIGSIFEPGDLWPGKYQIEIKVAPGYILKSDAESWSAALAEFARLTDHKFTLNK